MKRHNAAHFLLFMTAGGWLLSWASAPAGALEPGPADANTQVIRFDAIIELGAPIVGTDVTLFARYWVARDFYDVAVVWAEPYMGTINFPVFPMTLVIDSDRAAFSLSHQLDRRTDRTFAQPISDRGVFRYRHNDYPLGNIRFAEREALATRLYARDMNDASDPNGGWATVDVRASGADAKAKRAIARARVRRNDKGIEALDILGDKGTVLKGMKFDYLQAGKAYGLRRVDTVLPPTPIRADPGSEILVRINGEERRTREVTTTYHAGGRRCLVDYQQVPSPGKPLCLPAQIDVRRQDTGLALRSARMVNYVQLRASREQCRKAAEEFCHLAKHELKHREFLPKYWLKPVADTNEPDIRTMREMRNLFQSQLGEQKSLGEKLKSTNTLMATDFMLGDPERLQVHFAHYLELLRTHKLEQMVLAGGKCVIETAVRWNQLGAADRLQAQWIEAAISTRQPGDILRFAQTELDKGRCWITAGLVGKSLQVQPWGALRFQGEAIRVLLLYRLRSTFDNAESAQNRFLTAQAAWVRSSFGTDKLAMTMRQSLDEAKQTFARSDAPTREDKIAKAEIDRIEQKLLAENNPAQ
jgi:hypothetical protein